MKMYIAILVFALPSFVLAAPGDYIQMCGRLKIDSWSEKTSIESRSQSVELEGLSEIMYPSGALVCVTGYEGRTFSGKKMIRVVFVDSK